MPHKTFDPVGDAMRALHDAGKVVTTRALEVATGIKKADVAARMSYLVDNGEAYRLQPGVFAPAHKHKPTRIISTTHLPDGTVSVEVGDDVIQLNPQEHRILGVALAGGALQHINITTGHATALAISEMRAELKKVVT